MSNLKIIKSFILAFLLILSSALSWKGLADIYLHDNLSVSSFIWFGLSLVLFVVFFLFFSLLVDYKIIYLIIYPLSLLTCFLFFPCSLYLIIGLVVFYGAMILSRILMQKERKERLNISVRGVFKNGLPWLMTILALLIGLISYLYPLTPGSKNETNLPPAILNLFIKPLAGTIGNILPMVDENTTIDQALAMSTVTQSANLISLSPELLAQLKGKNIKDLNPSELLKDPKIAEILKNQAKKVSSVVVTQQRNDLAKTLGISLTGKETMSELMSKVVNAKIKEMLGPTIGALPIISGILIFLVLRLIFIPLGWLVLLLALLIFQLLRIFKFVKIEKVMKEGEDVRL